MHAMPFVALLVSVIGCSSEAPAPVAPAMVSSAPSRPARPPPSADKPDAEKTIADIAVGSPDHTTLVAALGAAGLVDALASPGGVYTVFAPTNDAFGKLPQGTVEGLLAPDKKADLTKILRHHAAVPVMLPAELKDGTEISMSDGTKVTVHVDGDKLKIDGANVLGSVRGMNGIVYVVDGVLLPPAS